jgi:hypothetical protein
MPFFKEALRRLSSPLNAAPSFTVAHEAALEPSGALRNHHHTRLSHEKIRRLTWLPKRTIPEIARHSRFRPNFALFVVFSDDFEHSG